MSKTQFSSPFHQTHFHTHTDPKSNPSTQSHPAGVDLGKYAQFIQGKAQKAQENRVQDMKARLLTKLERSKKDKAAHSALGISSQSPTDFK